MKWFNLAEKLPEEYDRVMIKTDAQEGTLYAYYKIYKKPRKNAKIQVPEIRWYLESSCCYGDEVEGNILLWADPHEIPKYPIHFTECVVSIFNDTPWHQCLTIECTVIDKDRPGRTCKNRPPIRYRCMDKCPLKDKNIDVVTIVPTNPNASSEDREAAAMMTKALNGLINQEKDK